MIIEQLIVPVLLLPERNKDISGIMPTRRFTKRKNKSYNIFQKKHKKTKYVL